MNRRIETFDYGVIEASNRPRGNLTTSQLNGGDSLKQSGEYCTLNKHKIGDPCNSNKDTGIHVIHTTLASTITNSTTVQYKIIHLQKYSTIQLSAVQCISPLCHCYLASKMWCLGRYLPLLFGDVVEPDDVFWQHYLDLLTIMDYIFAPGTDGRSLGVRNQTYIRMYAHRNGNR